MLLESKCLVVIEDLIAVTESFSDKMINVYFSVDIDGEKSVESKTFNSMKEWYQFKNKGFYYK